MTATVPADKSQKHIIDFCRRISLDKPILLAITPYAGCQPLDCFNNVKSIVSQRGGRIQFGWSVWEWPEIYVEAEHHAVYDPENGSDFVDVTPAPDDDRYRLFLPDNRSVYNFDEPKIRENIRMARNSDPLVKELFRLSEEINAIKANKKKFGWNILRGREAAEFSALNAMHSDIFYQLGMKYTKKNSPCFCGSKTKFKKCHGITN